MNGIQLQLDFNPVHTRENNPESQRVLDLRRDDFNEQCWLALTLMLNGEFITNKDSRIGHMARRAKDLIDRYGIPVQREWAVVDNVKQDYKWYYILPEDRFKVAKRIIDRLVNINPLKLKQE
jgi:hypothetical protein